VRSMHVLMSRPPCVRKGSATGLQDPLLGLDMLHSHQTTLRPVSSTVKWEYYLLYNGT